MVTCKSFKLEFQMLENQIEFQILENQIEYLADESSYLVHIILLKTSMTWRFAFVGLHLSLCVVASEEFQ